MLADPGSPKGLKTQLHATGGYGRDLLDAVQLIQQYLKNVGIEAELKLQEYGAYMATTVRGQVRGDGVCRHGRAAGEPDSLFYGMYAPDQPRNWSCQRPQTHGDAEGTTADEGAGGPEATHFRHTAVRGGATYYVTANSGMVTGSWQPYVKHYAPNLGNDYGNRAAALWLDR